MSRLEPTPTFLFRVRFIFQEIMIEALFEEKRKRESQTTLKRTKKSFKKFLSVLIEVIDQDLHKVERYNSGLAFHVDLWKSSVRHCASRFLTDQSIAGMLEAPDFEIIDIALHFLASIVSYCCAIEKDETNFIFTRYAGTQLMVSRACRGLEWTQGEFLK